MTEITNKIMEQLKNASSTKPMSFNALKDEIKTDGPTLTLLLNHLYANHFINQAEITKRDPKTEQLITQMWYWPTAIIQKASKQFVISHKNKPIDQTLTRPPRRNEVIQQSTITPMIKEPAVTNTVLMTEPIVGKTEAMVKFIFENNGATSDQLALLIGEKFQSDVPSRLKHLTDDDGILLAIKIVNEHSKTVTQYLFRDGKTIDDFYKRSRAPKSSTAAFKPNILPPFEAVADTQNVASFTQSPPPNQFKVAITSDYTLILMGLSDKDIELTQAQSDVLFKFINQNLPCTHHAQ